VVAVIGEAGSRVAAQPAAASAEAASEPEVPEAAVGQQEAAPQLRAVPGGRTDRPEAAASATQAGAASRPAAERTKEDLRRHRSSPLVRRIAREHNVDIEQINGTGISGRVTKHDILDFIESGKAAPAAPPVPKGGPAYRPKDRVEIVPMTIMRRKIAEHMVLSAHTSPHVYSVYEVNFGRLAQLRDKKKGEYERAGGKLSFTALIAKVVVDALRAFPVANASIDGDNIVYKKDFNLGIAVALEQGLIVPVIKNADERNLLGLCRAIEDLAGRARSKKLNPDEVQNGTFTITNPGVFGAVYGLPLINQPQVAILGVGAIEKRPLVIDDAIGIRPTCHLSLGYDHRLIDGADAGRFLSFIKERLEHFDEGWM
jgi:2-oxoglutarate dehydrogenase E2 component (dihydrolipoamide succinyltransferase)